MATLRIISKNSVIVGTWKPGEVFRLRAGDNIALNQCGVPMFRGKILNLSADVQRKLVDSRRAVLEA
jgi:hypothetical protein